ncbi:hypothetical protein HAX54_048205 [Datura stramonium]|uniref:Uncharacterized protein n=1 Tax=Datura stramonium TaxID=4076 RepID=A0ABS8STK8_DATST|nr:hypothetical protein [Datura stramonium]
MRSCWRLVSSSVISHHYAAFDIEKFWIPKHEGITKGKFLLILSPVFVFHPPKLWRYRYHNNNPFSERW